MREYGLHIGGQSVKTAKLADVTNKFTGEVFARICVGTADNVRDAVDVARDTQRIHPLTPTQIQAIFVRAADLIRARRQTIARTMALESGMTIKDALGEIERAIHTLVLSGEEAKRISGHVVPIQSTPGMENRMAFTIRVPVGVVGAITPFNAPFNNVCHKIAPAIAAGNAIVLKPAPATPLSALAFVEILEEAGLPAGFANIVTGDADVGAALLADQRIGFYSFTGSEKVGAIVKRDSGFRRVALELGNNSACIVCADADLELAAPLIVRGGYRKAGQVCVSVQRVYVHRSVAARLGDMLASHIAKLKVGDPLDPETDVGPLITAEKCVELLAWIDEAVSAGARIAAGGRRLDGNIIEPTLLVDASQSMSVVCKEVFGPVISLVPFGEIDEAIDAVNDSPYGLQSGIFTTNIDVAFKAARRLNVGGVNINETSNTRGDIMPYGGVKHSGFGREGPYYAIREMTDERLVMINHQEQ
ncbi:aldehyde dehydrogenase family protein [Aureimonas fodinaquatilis]|uniref:Aldehyde dehydrogenase family protein n=1 Tax=Aureimonas fodinaquatilis TaxID=2565783 RepID=A0A5B0DST8_9HYPH|nr:aldehyde dehydrogenase family protein [Aureimonas fodinaquatilis]KAA0969072.1 aldehyde dehydrogenase family protein [Aureimonas fodinaquatilis]